MRASRTAGYKPALAGFTALGGAWVFVLVTLGALTTSMGAGMVFPDWPLSNGSLNPAGWLEDISKFAEHSHRLSGAIMGVVSIVTLIWLWRTEARAWLRKLAAWALVIVIVQGVLGGTRVLLDPIALPGFQMTLGQVLRIPHGVLAQVYVCLVIAIAAGCSQAWVERPPQLSRQARRLGAISCGLLLVQLTVAATMRHNGAGLAIPSFPHSTPDGHWLPAHWDFRVGIHFAHRLMAVPILVALPLFAFAIRRAPTATLPMRIGASAILSLLALQILLGMEIIRTFRRAGVTTSHVVVGALLLATVFWLTWFAHRAAIERKPGP